MPDWFYPSILPVKVHGDVRDKLFNKLKKLNLDVPEPVKGLHAALIGNNHKIKDPGPHSAQDIAAMVAAPGMNQPHLIDVLDYRPDEDECSTMNLDYISIIVSTGEPMDMFAPLYWGEGRKFCSAFIIVRKLNGLLYPWDDMDHVVYATKKVIDRQDMYEPPERVKIRKKSIKNFDTLEQLMEHLKK